MDKKNIKIKCYFITDLININRIINTESPQKEISVMRPSIFSTVLFFIDPYTGLSLILLILIRLLIFKLTYRLSNASILALILKIPND